MKRPNKAASRILGREPCDATGQNAARHERMAYPSVPAYAFPARTAAHSSRPLKWVNHEMGSYRVPHKPVLTILEYLPNGRDGECSAPSIDIQHEPTPAVVMGTVGLGRLVNSGVDRADGRYELLADLDELVKLQGSSFLGRVQRRKSICSVPVRERSGVQAPPRTGHSNGNTVAMGGASGQTRVGRWQGKGWPVGLLDGSDPADLRTASPIWSRLAR